jgi:sulfhydrogenase subunit beta (sulfur reductase)
LRRIKQRIKMMQKIISKDKISEFISNLQKEYKIFGPVREKGDIEFKEVKSADEMDLDYLNSKIPPKSVLFPMIDTLFSYKKDGEKVEIIENKPYDKVVIFGIRPCDAQSFYLLHNFFNFGKFKDPNFLDRLLNTVLIGIGCLNPRSTCFCTSVNGSPFNSEHVDILLTEFKENYFIMSSTDDGDAILKKMDFLTDPKDNDVKEIEEIQKKVKDSMKVIEDLGDLHKLLDNMYDDPLWEECALGCLGCGTCSYLCPTCHCFDVVDENNPDGSGRRARIWDTCQFPLFTLETSGHNPRTNKIPRARQRIYHKFNYYPKNYNLIGCVGCGRCILYCPVSNDVREIFSKIKKAPSKTEG